MKLKEACVFGVFVFWLISFPMNGFLMPGGESGMLPWFVLANAAVFLVAPRFLRLVDFDLLTRIGAVSTVAMTIAFQIAPRSRPALLVAMGISAPLVLMRIVAGLRRSPDPVFSAGLGIAIGNFLVFALSRAPLGNPVKFFILAALLLLPACFRGKIPDRPEAPLRRRLNRYLPVIFTYYLVGGLLYSVLMPRYDRIAFSAGIELLFYVGGAIVAIGVVKRVRDHVLALGSGLGILSLSLMLPGEAACMNLSMYAMQASFGFVDLYMLALILDCGAAPEVAGAAFGVQCLAIAAGETLVRSVGQMPLFAIATGNVIMAAAVLGLYFTHTRENAAAVGEPGGEAPSGNPPSPDAVPPPETLESRLLGYYDPHQKRLSGKEIQVLSAILDGRTYREAGEALGISESSVKTYMRRIYEKTGVRSKDEIRALLFGTGIPD